MTSDGSRPRRLPVPVVIGLAVIAVFGVLMVVNWVLASFFSILRVAVVVAVIAALAIWAVSAKANR